MQVQDLMNELTDVGGDRAIILVFVHGWKHNARSMDENLAEVDKVLFDTAAAERSAKVSTQGETGNAVRPVLGVFVGWRGLSFYFGWLTNITFWNRRTAAQRVATGAVREVFGRLRDYRKRHNDEPVLIIIGHSFGGLVVYSALAQSLIEGAALGDAGDIETGFADLVLLINPAFEAARYLPVHYAVKNRTFAKKQPPLFISVTAENDDATGKAFPAGAWLASRWEHTNGIEEKQALIHTMGHLPWLRTHRLTASIAAPRTPVVPVAHGQSGWKRMFTSGAVLSHVQGDPDNPFWVVTASKEVIDGHNGIFGSVFQSFIRELVVEQMK